MSDNDSSSNVASVSFLSSNFDNLELARAKAAESIVNVNQYFLEINGEIKEYADKYSLLGDNKVEDNEIKSEFSKDVQEYSETNELTEQNLATFVSELEDKHFEEDNANSKDDFTILPRSWTLQSQYALPNIKQILDTQTSQQYAAGMIALKSAQWSEAIVYFTKCIHLKPHEPSYYVNRAEVFIQLADFQSAILNYKKACILEIGNQQFYTRLAFLYVFQSQILFDQEHYSEALEAIGRAIEMTPNNKVFHLQAVGCLAALNRHSECLAIINKQIDVDNTNADFYVLRAKLHSNFRNFSLCYYDIMDALKIDPAHIEANKVLQRMAEEAESLKDYGVERGLNNRLQEAISKLSLAIDLNPVIGDFHVKRGAFYRRLKDFTAAIDDFIMAMDKVDHNEENETYKMAQRQLILTFNDFAVSCFNKGGFEEALTLLNKAIQAEKNEAAFYMNRGDCFFQLKQWDFAIADYCQAGSMSSFFLKSSFTRSALVYFCIGQSDFNNENYIAAEKSFTKALENNPFPSIFWSVRCRTRYLIEDFKGSRKDLICSIILSGFDKKMESIFTRLFPGKTIANILESKFAKNNKIELDNFINSHRIKDENDEQKQKTFEDKEKTNNNGYLSVCGVEEKMLQESLDKYHLIEKEIKMIYNDKSLIKRSEVSVKDYPDFETLVQDNSDICGIVGRTDGSKYLINNKGILIKAKNPRGWRKFKSGIT